MRDTRHVSNPIRALRVEHLNIVHEDYEATVDHYQQLFGGLVVFDRLQPYATGGQYVNFPGLYEDNDAMVRGAFGQNLGRLTAIKNQYDPTNLFRLNHNIALGQ